MIPVMTKGSTQVYLFMILNLNDFVIRKSDKALNIFLKTSFKRKYFNW